jgi:FkbM family methyltransferase
MTATVAERVRFLHRGLKARWRNQRVEIGAIRGAVRPDDVVVDVGANKGSYLRSLSLAVPRGRVVAFEPQPLLAAYLARLCAASGYDNVVVEAAGVSSRDGTLTLAIPGDGAPSPGASFENAVRAGAPTSVHVPVRSLDGYFAGETRRIGAMKIDVEGHEMAVLEGAERILREHGPLIVIEIVGTHTGAGSVEAVLDHLRTRSYDGHFVHRGRLEPLSTFRPERHQRVVGERYLHHPDFCDNFVLTRRR